MNESGEHDASNGPARDAAMTPPPAAKLMPPDTVLAGVAAAATLLLLLSGTFLGLLPWSSWTLDSAVATSFGLAFILYISLGQMLASRRNR